MQGAHTIFATTDFWSTYRDPNATSQVAEGQTLNQYSFETEVQQGKNIAEAASKIKTLELFIWSDLVSVRDTSGGKWTWAYHFDSKAEVEKYIKAELPNLSAKTSYFIPGAYVANLERFWKPAKVRNIASNNELLFLLTIQQSDGRYLLQQPGSGNIPFYWIDTVHDSGLFVKALTELAHGQKLLGYGSKMSLKEAIKLWGEVKGVDARFEEVPLEAWGSDWPDQGIRREIAEMMMFMGEYDYAPKEDPTLVLASDVSRKFPSRNNADCVLFSSDLMSRLVL